MIRPLTIVTFMMACGSGLYLYQSKHEAQVLDRTIERTLRETATFREQSRLLAAEWTMLNDPESLRRFSDTHLALKTIAPSQFTSLADLDNRLPPVPMPASAADTPDEAGEPVAAVAPPPSPSADIPPTDIAGDGVYVASRPLPPLSASNTPVTSVPAVARPAERKVAVSRPAPMDPAYRPAATDPAPPSRVSANLESGPAGQHGADLRNGDRRVSQPAETNVAETRVGDTRAPVPVPQSRPMVVAATSRPLVTSPPVASPPPGGMTAVPQAPVQTPRGGSLLGMARGPVASPLPRPTPINAAQSYSTN